MKKSILVLGAIFVLTGAAFADGNAFTPLNFNDTAYSKPAPTSVTAQTINAIAESEAIGNGNIQNAISQ